MSYGEDLMKNQKVPNDIAPKNAKCCSFNFNGTIITFDSFEDKRRFIADIYGIELNQVKIDDKDANSSKVEIIEVGNSENKTSKIDNGITFVEGFTGRKYPSGAIKCIIYKDEIINNADKNGRIEFWLNTSKKNNSVYGSLIV